MYQDFYSKKKIINKSLKGYTLIELVISMFFFATITICLSLPFCNSISLSASDQDMVNANSLARKYLKSIEIQWQFQTDYDLGELPAITSNDTLNGRYNVTVTQQDVALNSSDIVILRRIEVKYKDKSNNTLVDLFSDINRPESAVN